MIYYPTSFQFDIVSKNHNTVIEIVDEDTFTLAAKYKESCCLNFASHKRPGGGYISVMDIKMPIKTQEEDLFRRSNLPALMDTEYGRSFYPMKHLDGLYTPDVIVDKDKNLNPVKLFKVSVITLPAVVDPNTPEKLDLSVKRAKRILEIAAHNNQETLILGAWGCGIFNNEPSFVATTFKNFIDNEFKGVFKEVLFAIPGKESHNYREFAKIIDK